jgi:hypothetical protein
MLFGVAGTAGVFLTLGCYLLLCAFPNSIYILFDPLGLNYARFHSKLGLQAQYLHDPAKL